MLKRKSLLILALVLALVLLFTGCPFAKPATPAAGQGVLNLYGTDPTTLDPAISADITSHEFVSQIFEGLVRLGDDLEPAPGIAQSWQLSPDGRTYTFSLRRDVKFHDGKEVKASDFKYSWERTSSPATGSQTASTYLGDIVGVKEMLAGQATGISGVRVVDDYTLSVTIDSPKSYFLSKLTYPTAFVVDRANVESGGEWWRNPNGTGPFKLKQWDARSLLVLERNGQYYGETAKLQAVNYHLWAGVPVNLYETGQIDVTGIGASYIDRAEDPAGPFYGQMAVVPELSFSFIGFDQTRPPFDDANVRRAFSLAIDKDKLIRLVFRNTAERADGILPPGIPGYNKDLSGMGFDTAKAKELIAQSKYGSVSNLPPITITTYGYGGLVSGPLEAIIAEWRQNLGVEVAVRQLELEPFLYRLKQEKDEMYLMGWIADYPHPQNFLDILFHSGAETNYGGYSNPEVDALIDEAASEQDRERSLALYQQAEQKIVDDAASIPLWFGENYILVKPYVKGYQLNPLGYSRLNGVTVEGR